VIEQSNRLASFQGGPGIDSQNDATGLQMRNNRKRAVPDGDSPFSSSSPFRRTLKKRSDTTRHKGEFELYNSSVVSQLARSGTVSSSVFAPFGTSVKYYGVPFLPVDASGNGSLAWGFMDGDSPFESSNGAAGAQRKTLQRRAGNTPHKNDFEMYNSSTVSAKGRSVTSLVPQYYAIPFLPVNSNGHGNLTWAPMDADELGDVGPRSLERRSSSSGERFQVYAFDDAASTLDTSEVTQTAVRRRYGSSGNHYIAWVNSSDFSNPRWNEILEANADVDFVSDAGRSLYIGKIQDSSTDRDPWEEIYLSASGAIKIEIGEYDHAVSEAVNIACNHFGAWIYLNKDAGDGKNDILLKTTDGDINVIAEKNMIMTAYGTAAFGSISEDCIVKANGGDLRLRANPDAGHSPAHVEIALKPLAAAAAYLKISDLQTTAGPTDTVYVTSSGYLKLS